MKILNIIKYLFGALAVVFIFFNWKLAILFWIVGHLLHVFPLGPNPLLSVMTGDLIIAGLIFMFVDWRIGVGLIISGFLVTRFRIWMNKKNYDYYNKKNKNHKAKKKNKSPNNE